MNDLEQEKNRSETEGPDKERYSEQEISELSSKIEKITDFDDLEKLLNS